MKSSLFEAAALAGRLASFDYPGGGGAAAEGPAAPVAEEATRAADIAAAEAAARKAERALLEQHFLSDLERRVQHERDAVRAALDDFERRRRGYFQGLERSVVELALGLAGKILRREAQMDPLLLSGAVRVALDQLADAREVEVVVPPSTLAAWREHLAAAGVTRLSADPALEPHGCRLLTPAGSTDLGLDTQLREVERGFADLLRRRDAAALDA